MRYTPRALAPHTGDGATIVGTGDVWADDDDATYISIADSTGVVAKYARGELETYADVGASSVPTAADVLVRFKSVGPFGNVRLFLSGSSVLHEITTVTADPEAGWWRGALSEADRVEFLDRWASHGLQYVYQFNSAFNGGGPLIVYEAHVVIEWGRVAPPCRLFPREDGLGVGGGRIFPPPKSQQRSGRRFGYY